MAGGWKDEDSIQYESEPSNVCQKCIYGGLALRSSDLIDEKCNKETAF